MKCFNLYSAKLKKVVDTVLGKK